MSTITERVERGAALLDERRPGWLERVDLDRLDLASPCNCVAAQLEGFGYVDAIDSLGLNICNEVEYGFESDDGDAYPDLTDAWHDLITCRREMTGAST